MRVISHRRSRRWGSFWMISRARLAAPRAAGVMEAEKISDRALCLMYFPNSFAFYFCITWLFTYLQEKHGFAAASRHSAPFSPQNPYRRGSATSSIEPLTRM